jgi:hypothetical protein
MAMKKMTGGKKPVAKMAAKAKPKTVATKSRGAETKPSRGSKTDKQMGDMNQRESYNSQRDKNNKIVKQWAPLKVSTSADKVTKSRAGIKVKGETSLDPNHQLVKESRKLREQQRAGGKVGVTSAGKSNPKAKTRGGSMPKYVPKTTSKLRKKAE